MTRVLTVLGTRPEIIRLSLTIAALDRACDHHVVYTGQNADPRLSDVFFDELGIPKPDYHLEAGGGSHATHWYPPLNRIAKHRGWRLLTAVKGNCRFLTGPFGDDEGGRSCRSWIDDLLRLIERDPPDFIITTSTVTHPQGERVPPGYVSMWRKLDRLGIPVVAIRDTPRGRINRVDCLAEHTRDIEACDIARSPAMDAVDPASLLKLPGNVILVDVTDYLCTPEVCPAVVGNVVVYRDRHHLTGTYALTLSPMLADQIPRDPPAVYRAANP